MNTHSYKASEDKSKAIAGALPKLQSGYSVQFINTRPEAIAQRKLQDIADNSPQVKQLSTYRKMADESPIVKKVGQLWSMAAGSAAGQVQHLSHKAMQVAPLNQGRATTTIQMKDMQNVNDNEGLEKEANEMGHNAPTINSDSPPQLNKTGIPSPVVQGVFRKRSGKLIWVDMATGEQYQQIEVQVDNRIRLKGKGKPFYITYKEGQWDLKDVPRGPAPAPENMPVVIPAPSAVSLPMYRQADDPTVIPFLKAGRKFMGQRGAESQARGVTPPESHVREDAEKHPAISAGGGLHELLPTNMRDKVAASGSENARAIQSGARTATPLTAFRRLATEKDAAPAGAGEVGLHTGFAAKPGGTRGQAGAHEKMREIFDLIVGASSADEAVNLILLRHIEIIPTGEEVLSSIYLAGITPQLKDIGKLEAVSSSPGPNRVKLARLLHDIREELKERARGLKRASEEDGLRSPSPPRMRLTSTGSGGGRSAGPRELYPTAPVPPFEGAPGSFAHTSNMAAWGTQPQRLGSAPAFAGAGVARDIVKVADLEEAKEKSWNASDRMEIADGGKLGQNVVVRWLKKHEGGTDIVMADIWIERKGS